MAGKGLSDSRTSIWKGCWRGESALSGRRADQFRPWASLQSAWQCLKLRPQVTAPVGGIILLFLLFVVLRWYAFEKTDKNGVIHHPHADILNPIGAAIAGAIVAYAALRQARTATLRHKEQTDAD